MTEIYNVVTNELMILRRLIVLTELPPFSSFLFDGILVVFSSSFNGGSKRRKEMNHLDDLLFSASLSDLFTSVYIENATHEGIPDSVLQDLPCSFITESISLERAS